MSNENYFGTYIFKLYRFTELLSAQFAPKFRAWSFINPLTFQQNFIYQIYGLIEFVADVTIY